MKAPRRTGAAEAFRELQAGRPSEALELARSAVRADANDPAAHLAEGLALQMLGEADPALAAVERARALDPSSFAAHFSAGSLFMDRGDWAAAAERFRTAVALQPRQVEAVSQLARSLQRAGRGPEAEQAFIHALAAAPHDVNLLRAFGRFSVARGDWRRAATLYAEAERGAPGDEALPMYLAQVELLLGRWENAWRAYSRRVTRRQVEGMVAAQGGTYRVPALASLGGRDVQLICEQGYGDILFFLRWAPILRDAGATLRLVGPAAMLPLLARTGVFASLHDFSARDVPAAIPILVGDLPQVAASSDPLAVPGLRIPPLADRLERWRARLGQAGPRPWVGITWRAGKGGADANFSLLKNAPIAPLVAVARAIGGTAVVMQRQPTAAELREAGALPDFSSANDDLENALAVMALLDRYIGVSNTNMHLADAAGRTADVLVPFPPEWRWRAEGTSPWFPGFGVHRQSADGDWSAAFASIAC